MDSHAIQDIHFSVLLESHDMRQALQVHNQMIEDKVQLDKQNQDLKNEIEELKQTMHKQLEMEQPNVKEITDKMVKQAIEE